MTVIFKISSPSPKSSFVPQLDVELATHLYNICCILQSKTHSYQPTPTAFTTVSLGYSDLDHAHKSIVILDVSVVIR